MKFINILKKVDGWDVKSNEQKLLYIKNFKFNNFKQSQNFVNKIADIAEAENITQILVLDGVIVKLKFNSCNKRTS